MPPPGSAFTLRNAGLGMPYPYVVIELRKVGSCKRV